MADGKVVIDVILEDGSVGKGVADLDRQLGGLGGSGEKASLGIGKIASALGLVYIAKKGIDLVRDSLDGAIDRYDTLNQFPKVMQMIGFDAQESEAAIGKLSDGIDGLPTTLDSVASTAQNIAVMTGDLDGAVDTTLALNNAFLASGASSSDAERGLQQYVQMLSKGEVDLQSWRTLQETMGVALRTVAGEFGFTGKAATNDLYDALKSGEITMDEFNDKLIEASNAQGGFADMASEASAGIKTSWTNMKTAVVKGLADVIGAIDEALGGTGEIQGIIERMKESFQSVFAWIVGQVPVVAGVLKSIYTTLKPWLPLIKAISVAVGAFITAFLTINSVISVINMVRNAIIAMNAALLANPIVLVVALIIAAVALIYVYWEPISEFFSSLWEGIKTVFMIIWNAIVNHLTETWNAILEIAMPIFEALSEFFSMLWEGIVTIALAIWNVFIMSITEIWNMILEFAMPIFEALAEFFSMLWEGITEAATIAWEFIIAVLTAIWDRLVEVYGPIFEAMLEIASAVWETIKSVTSTVWNTILTVLTTVWNTLKSTVSTVFNAIKTVLTTVWNTIKSVTSTVWNGIKSVLTTIWNLVKSLAKGEFNSIKDVITMVWNTIKTVTSTVWNTIKSVISTVWNAIKSVITTVVNAVKSVVTSVFNAIRSNITTVMNAVRSVITTIWNGIKSTITSVVNGIKSTISNIFNSLKGIVTGAMSGVKNAVSNGIKGALRDIMHPGITNSMAENIKKGSKKPIGEMDSLTDALSDEIEPEFAGLKNLKGLTADSIVGSLGVTDMKYRQVVKETTTAHPGNEPQKQPVIINVHVGSKKVASEIVDDITNIQNRKSNRKRKAPKLGGAH